MSAEKQLIEQAAKTINSAGHKTHCRFAACSCGAVDEFKSQRLEFFRLLESYKAPAALPEAQPTPPTEPDFLRKWYELMKANDPHQFAEHEEDDGGWDSPSTVCEYTFEHFCRSSFVKSWQRLVAQPTLGWISVKERLPVVGTIVVAYREDRGPDVVEYSAHSRQHMELIRRDGQWWDKGTRITHWQSLPSPPEPTPTKKENA